MAHKLNHKVCHPGPIEKQSVLLAQALFHESTIAALLYFANHDHPEFLDTAKFLSIINQWWMMVNVKSKVTGVMRRNNLQDAVHQSNLVEKTSFLRGFVEWLTEWEDQKADLSKETFQCAKVTCKSLALLCEYLISEKESLSLCS
jgi:hypothetical protein